MRTIHLQRRSGVRIAFETDLSVSEARAIILDADRCGQNVGDFALSLARQRWALSDNQYGWLIYLAMQISGQFRSQPVTRGPWSWLLQRTIEENPRYRVLAPTAISGDRDQTPCRLLLLRRAPQFMTPEDRAHSGHEWRYVGRVDAFGGFHFSRELLQQVSGKGRGAMAIKFPEQEQRIRDEARWLQWQAAQILEGLKHSDS